MTRIILASGSPRRRELLESLKIAFEVRVSHVEEVLGPHEAPDAYVRRLSIEKGESVARLEPDALVIAADTTVYVDGTILEKPSDVADAERMLGAIAGKTHTVFTGLTLLRDSAGIKLTEVERTEVTMSAMTAEEIAWYAATREPLDKAGAYAIQGIGAAFVELVNGSYTNVVGLPLPLLRRMLLRAGESVLGGAGS